MTAIRSVEFKHDRRVHYIPEMSLRRIVRGLVRETIIPHLQDSKEHIAVLEKSLNELDQDPPKILLNRMRALKTWQGKAGTILPFFMAFLGKSQEEGKPPESEA